MPAQRPEHHLRTPARTYSTPTETQGFIENVLTGTTGPYDWYSAKVIMNNAFRLRFTFTAPSDDLSNLSIVTNNKTYSGGDFKKDSNGRYYIEVTGISADKFREPITAQFFVNGNESGGEILNYNINTYVARQANNQSFGALAKALYNYGESAYAYTH